MANKAPFVPYMTRTKETNLYFSQLPCSCIPWDRSVYALPFRKISCYQFDVISCEAKPALSDDQNAWGGDH